MDNLIVRSVTWLGKPERLIFLCSFSFIVGVVFYGLSFSVHHLHEKWNLWAMIIYVVLLLFIFLAVFLAYKFRKYPKPWLLHHFVFIVLELTTAYSFFNEELEGKPDAYSLVSSASLAIMSLCLSKLCHSGIEVDILSFYCTLFTSQLMNLKLYLFFVGAIFNYSLIMLHFYLPDPNSENGVGSVELKSIQVDKHLEASNTAINSESSSTGNFDGSQENDYMLQTPPPPHPQGGIDNDDVELAQIQGNDTLNLNIEFTTPGNPGTPS